jgi:hypothetical protein
MFSLKYFWTHEMVLRGMIRLEWVSTEQIIADGLTKPLSPPVFESWVDDILGVESGAGEE